MQYEIILSVRYIAGLNVYNCNICWCAEERNVIHTVY